MLQNKFRGVMLSPVTPLKDDFSLDLSTVERLLDFHVGAGAPAISWPHHKGESLNLAVDERKLFARMPSAPMSWAWRASAMVSSTASAETWMVTGTRQATVFTAASAKPGGIAALKAAARGLGRDYGNPRPPLLPLDAVAEGKLLAAIEALAALAAEPRDW